MLKTKEPVKKVLLVGIPNSGKSSLFNLLTGKEKKVANYSGQTVTVYSANIVDKDHSALELVDLPGLFSLRPNSLDEGISLSEIFNRVHSKDCHGIILILDWTRLTASLPLALSLQELFPEHISFIINKCEHLNSKQRTQLAQTLSESLKAPALCFSTFQDSPEKLKKFLSQLSLSELPHENPLVLDHDAKEYIIGNHYFELAQKIKTDDSKQAKRINDKAKKISQDIYQKISPNSSFSHKIDSLALHPIVGGLIFFSLFYLLFLSIYSWASPLMDFIDGGIGFLGQFISLYLPDGLIKSLLVDGVIAGVGGVVIFLPQIMILFFLLSLLEQSGYISRAAVVSDKLMSFFGLNGKAFLPYLSGFACSIPGIMATRTISDSKERLATLLTIPMVTCSARLPVYILLVGTFVPDVTLGLFNLRALSFFILYFLGPFAALIIAKVFRLTLFKGDTSSFVIDLPDYNLPNFKVALKNSWSKGKNFLRKAGTVILGFSIIIWLLSTFPRSTFDNANSISEEQKASYQLEHSVLGKLGKGIEPAIKPLGMNWKMGVGLLVSLGARELFVSTLGTLYALGDDVGEDSTSLKENLLQDRDPQTNIPTFNLAVAWSILIFFVFSLQCTSTIAVIKSETKSWKMAGFAFSYMLVLAYLGSFIVYQTLIRVL